MINKKSTKSKDQKCKKKTKHDKPLTSMIFSLKYSLENKVSKFSPSKVKDRKIKVTFKVS